MGPRGNSGKGSSAILIVDDNPNNLQVLGKALLDNNYGVEFATNGEQALNWLSERKFDLVLLDINMPGMDGYEVCKRIRSDSSLSFMPIIFLSADNEREAILKGFELGGQDYVTKPFDNRELLVRIKTHLALKDSLERLEEEKEKARAADNLKSAFLATMSHELRTPLNSIIGFSGILLKEKPGPLNTEQKKQLGMVQDSARHLLSLINDVLDISKIEAGQLTMNYQICSLSEIVNIVADTCRPMAEKKNILLEVDLDFTRDEIISDPLRVSQILLNLVNNAVKFTDKGKVIITGKCLEEFAELKIIDTGIGIEKSNIELLFRPFMQISTGIARKYEGTGLGLSICKKLLDMLNGKIEVESSPGKGSIFTVKLPFNSQH
jgi:two-component system, sensor histidine kinase and response regulator